MDEELDPEIAALLSQAEKNSSESPDDILDNVEFFKSEVGRCVYQQKENLFSLNLWMK